MSRILLSFLLLIPVILSGMILEVKKADVVVSINDKQMTLHKGDMHEVTVGSKVEFIEGKGRVIIDKRQMSSRSRVKSYVVPENDKEELYKVVFEDLTSKIKDNRQTAAGLGRKGVDGVVEHMFLVTSAFVMIQSEAFGPLPVTASIYNDKNELEVEFINEDKVETLFIFDKNEFKSGSKLVISTDFGEVVSYTVK